MIKRTFIIFFILISVNAWSQPGSKDLTTKSKKAARLYNRALNALDTRYLDRAILELQEAVKEDPEFIEAYIVMGDTYARLKNCSDAVENYKKAYEINADFFPTLVYLMAIQQMNCGMYRDALSSFEKSMFVKGNNADHMRLVQIYINRCEFAVKLMDNPVKFNPQNLGQAINSSWDEYLPTITADEETFIFTVRRPKDQYTICAGCTHEEDFYISQKGENGEWLARKALGRPVNTPYNEGAQTISPDGKYLVFTGCNRPDGEGSCDLYWSKRIGKIWTTPRNIGRPVNTSAWESQPSFAADGKTIYFTSNRPGGLGGTDIWKTTMIEEGMFTEPENISTPINTQYNEVSPFIHSDGKTIYFSSDGHKGMGGKDLFLSRMDAQNNWTEPVNLGYPINTVDDEVNLIVNTKGNIAFYSSDKPGGFGGLDIYWFELDESIRPIFVTYFKGKVFDELTSKPLEANIELINVNTGDTISIIKSDAQTGEFLVCIPTDNEYAVNVNNEKFLFYSDNFNLTGIHSETEPFFKDIPLKSMRIGEVVVLKNVFFDTDKFDLKPASIIELNKLADLLLKNRNIKIEIGGHTDNQGSREHNRVLSNNRAKSVYEYLISKGIDKSRLSFKGYGMDVPMASNDTPEGRAINRRTEFKITAF